jgi:hypothetical protein
LEGLGQLKNPMTSSEIETASFRLVEQCLNQLCYCLQATPMSKFRRNREERREVKKAKFNVAEFRKRLCFGLSCQLNFAEFGEANSRYSGLEITGRLYSGK